MVVAGAPEGRARAAPELAAGLHGKACDCERSAAIAAIVLACGATLAVSVRPGTAPPARSVLDADDTDRWPKTLDDFLAGNYLRRADIVLTRRE